MFNLHLYTHKILTLNYVSQILVGILTVLYVADYAANAIILDYGPSTDPTFYFKVAEVVVASQYTALHYIGWRKQGAIQSIYTKVQTRSLSSGFSGKINVGHKYKLSKVSNYKLPFFRLLPIQQELKHASDYLQESWLKLFCHVYMLQSLLMLLHLLASYDWDPLQFFGHFEELGATFFFLPEDTSRLVRIPFGFLVLIVEIYGSYAEVALELFLLITILFFRELAMEAIVEIQSVILGAPRTSYQAVKNIFGLSPTYKMH